MSQLPLNINLEKGTVLLVNKPLEWTSFDVVNKIKMIVIRWLHKHLPKEDAKKIKPKIGHAGTLDPLATGLLIVCIGKETKNIEKYMAAEKEYTGTFYLGNTTPSFDNETTPDFFFETNHVTDDLIYQTAKSLTGELKQVPPVFSAIKKDGKRAYQSARAGEELQLEPRSILIKEFEITKIEMPLVYFRIVCSKGTYIRAIARDFGMALKSGAYLNSLCRTRIGEYSLKDAIGMDKIIESFEGNN
ncbi:MAG: tRNA pseudouridine(55) synthase TruB [Bacteroidia bacterium]